MPLELYPRGRCFVRFFCKEGEEHFCEFYMHTDYHVEHRHSENGHFEGRQAKVL